MKKNLCALFAITCALSYAQVGINTDNPSATLDIVGKPTNIVAKDGLIPPRISLTNLKAKTGYSSAQEGAIVFVNDLDAATGTGATVNVKTKGYYYFDGTLWLPLDTNTLDLRMVGTNNHITQDAGFGATGTSAGTGSQNIAIGKSTLNAITTGSNNIAIGENALTLASTNTNNIAIGTNAMRNASSTSSVGIGDDALSSFIETDVAYSSVAIGRHALKSATTARYSTAVGAYAANALVTGNGVTAIGNSALASTTGSRNTAVGYDAFASMTGGQTNTGLGHNVAYRLQDGSNNTILGGNSVSYWNPSGINNSSNTFVGSEILLASGVGISTNNFNSTRIASTTALGSQIFLNQVGATTTPTDVRNSLFLGAQTHLTPNLSGVIEYATAIGAGTKVGASNSIVLGRPIGTDGIIVDKVGIGTTKPTAALHVEGKKTSTDDTVGYFVGSVRATGQFYGDSPAYPDYVFNEHYKMSGAPNYKFMPLKDVEHYIKNNFHLPGVTGINDLKKSESGNYEINLNSLAIQSLEKIEELFLHTIDQQKEIDTLKSENKNLEERLSKLEKLLK